MSGKFLGQKDYPKIWKLSRQLNTYTVVIALLLGGVCFIFYDDIGSMFSKEKEVLSLFSSIFWIVILMQPINAIAFVFDGIFKGLAEAVILRNTLLAATFLGFIPALLLGDYYDLKLYAIWIAFFVWMLLRAGILFVIFNKRLLTNRLT